MTVFSGFVLYAVLWFMTLFLVLPLRLTTQGDAGSVVPGTPSSAPQDAQMRKRLTITTIASFVIWAIVAAIILSGMVGVDDIDFLYRATRG
jgi:predicted secreted protein